MVPDRTAVDAATVAANGRHRMTIAVIDGTIVVTVAVIIAVFITVITDGVQRRDADSRRRIARIILLLSLCKTYDTAI